MSDEEPDYERVKGDLEKAKAAWGAGVGRRNRIYVYLQTVFDIGQSWEREDKGIRYQLLMRKISNVDIGKRELGRFRVIVYCSSDPKTQSDFRVRNKWVQWLELGSEEMKEGQTFEQFVKQRGGSLSNAPFRE
jgi:hypothetical protein